MERASEEFDDWVKETAKRIADRHFYATVSGVSFPNDDGSDRQELIAQVHPYDPLDLVPEPENPFHNQAIKVMCAGRQLGYLDRRCAQELTNKMTAGARFTAAVCERREAGHRPGQPHVYALVIVIFELNARERTRVRSEGKRFPAQAV